MGKKLIGLLKSDTGTVHAMKDRDAQKAYCGFQYKEKKNITYSGRSWISCRRCQKQVPEDII